MLAHSPPLPLDFEYINEDVEIAAEDEEGAILALKKYNRVRRVQLGMPATSLQKQLIVAMDDEYPILDYLIVAISFEDKTSISQLPETFQAPHLRHLYLHGFALPIGSRLLTSAVGLVTLCLSMTKPIHLLSSKYPAPMAFIYAPAGDAVDSPFYSLFPIVT
jgi:hypothetical protein